MVAFCFPWRPSPERQRLFDVVIDYYQSNFDLEVRVFTADSDGPVFSRSQAINRAVAKAAAEGHQVIVINDADTMCHPVPLMQAIEQTAEDKKTRLPYDKYIMMTAAQTEHFIQTYQVAGGVYEGACSGVLVVHVDTFPGFDERYIGWGAEDIDFAIRAQPVREHGTVWALLHTAEPRVESMQRNVSLLRETHGQHL